MRKPKKYEHFIVYFLLLSFLCSSCAVYRADHLLPLSQWPPEPLQRKKSISIVVAGEGVLEEKEVDILVESIKDWRKLTVRAYSESDLFSEVKPGLFETDLRAEVKIINEGKVKLRALSGFTLSLIPFKTTDKFIVRTTIKDRDGNTLGIFEKSEDVNSLVWLANGLIPILIIDQIIKESIAETIYDLNRSIISEAHAKGLFLVGVNE